MRISCFRNASNVAAFLRYARPAVKIWPNYALFEQLLYAERSFHKERLHDNYTRLFFELHDDAVFFESEGMQSLCEEIECRAMCGVRVF